MQLPVTSLLAGVLAILFIALSFRVIGIRRRNRVSLGDGGDAMLARRIRAHGNFAEYAPMGILLCGLCEAQGAPAALVAAGAVALGAGRLAHGYALSFTEKSAAGRIGGMALTFAGLGLFAAMALWLAIAGA